MRSQIGSDGCQGSSTSSIGANSVNNHLHSAGLGGIKDKPSRASVASRAFESLATWSGIKSVTQQKASIELELASATRSLIRGQSSSKGLGVFRKNLQLVFS